jgi:hypothetical protein
MVMQAPIANGHATVIQVMPDFPWNERARQTALRSCKKIQFGINSAD